MSGAPQLVGLYRSGSAKQFGIVVDSKPFLFGLPLDKEVALQSLGTEWRNSVFERCDANGQVIEGAQKHGIPKGLGPVRA